MDRFLPREARKWLYGVCLSVVPLLVAYGIVEQKDAALWASLVGSVLAPTLALANLTPPPRPVDDPGLPTATVRVKAKRARPFFGRHPWVLDSAIDSLDGATPHGDPDSHAAVRSA